MATSSILENIQINNPKLIEEYVAALEKSETEIPVATDVLKFEEITDAEELRQIMLRGIEKWGKKN